MECISCKGREGSFSFKTIEVRTILNPGRNSLFKKNRIPATRTQKLGDLRELSVCDDCIESIYFVPITNATENMKREDFMKYYGLTKENADQFHKMLHGKFKAASRDLGQDSLDDREPNTELTEND